MYHMVDSGIVDGLRQRSAQRVGQSEYFTKASRQINRYEEQKDKPTVTLNKEKFLEERKELDSEKEQEELFDDMTDPTRPVYEMDGYGEEALDVSVDYLNLLGGNKIAIGGEANSQQVTQ
jgi:carboxyl-terminal processing protease